MVKEAIILVGGLGTRLKEAVPDMPKCMAPVAGKPFLSYVIDYLQMQGVERFIFSLGYKWGIIDEYLQLHYPTLNYTSVIEEEPLGTGGAIRLAIPKVNNSTVLVANGDTLFKVKVQELYKAHKLNNAECTLALKNMKSFDRYGVVNLNENNQITSFREKQFYESGNINGGIYLLNKQKFLERSLPDQFSFEKDYLEQFYSQGTFYGLVQNRYFIDIGMPADFQRAQIELKRTPLDLNNIDKSWTLFLDRDGVINDERVGEYVLNWGQFIFSKGVLDTFRILSEKFGRIIIVSNQRGVGKKLMTETDLQTIHYEMQREVAIVGGKIDKIYYCTENNDKSFYRKPNPGMAFLAIRDFPEIDPSKSIMVGNKPGDMRFGRQAGTYTVFVTTTNPHQVFPHEDIDLLYPDLASFAVSL